MQVHNYLSFMVFLVVVFFNVASLAQPDRTDSNLFGHVICSDSGNHLPFASVSVKGTTMGTSTDLTGHYQLTHLPEGTYTIRATHLGYEHMDAVITITRDETAELNFTLEEDALGLDEIVITGARKEVSRRNSPIIVNTINPRKFTTNHSATVCDIMSFTPGLRIENNCQNCGFTQVRMNGLEGPYTQILINSRPVFSGLAGVYGLELIPSNMIDRVEVTRGGGSALYGSNAIAGTVNLILKTPVKNSYEVGFSNGFTGIDRQYSGGTAQDYSLNFNTTLVSDDNTTGISLFGYMRDRESFDANDDSFSEIPMHQNVALGSRLHQRIGTRGRMTADLFHINESRRGGDRFDYPEHEANIAESVGHSIFSGALNYERFFRKLDQFSIYTSAQSISRDSYYGAEQSLQDYGHTEDFSWVIGTQYHLNMGASSLIAGLEHQAEWLKDKKLGYLDVDQAVVNENEVIDIPRTDNLLIADQNTQSAGVFAQYELQVSRLLVSPGLRLDRYSINNRQVDESALTGTVLSPRLTLKYDLADPLQVRFSYAQGYRAPQIFDEDLHIETSGSRKVIHKNSPNLKQETSRSYMASFDYSQRFGSVNMELMLEGFYTRLDNPFANEYGSPDESGTVIYTRVNAAKGAVVRGLHLEMNVSPSDNMLFRSGFTVQSSRYQEPGEFDEKRFFRTPNDYGYMTWNWQITSVFGFVVNGTYTGKMLVPYFGLLQPDSEEGMLKKSERFVDLDVNISYNLELNGTNIQLFSGMKNMFDAYQNDFDSGVDRDPGYVYGPIYPRMIFFGLRLGNSLSLF